MFLRLFSPNHATPITDPVRTAGRSSGEFVIWQSSCDRNANLKAIAGQNFLLVVWYSLRNVRALGVGARNTQEPMRASVCMLE